MSEVNKCIPKIDGMGLILGKPAYTDDVAPYNALIIKVLRSPYSFAEIKSINTDKAKNISGVECVLTYKDVPRNAVTRAGQGYPEPSPHDKFVLDKYVRYIGDEVAVVAAVNEKIAQEAIELIEVEYNVLEPVLDFEKAENHSSIIHPESEAHQMFEIGYNPSKNLAAQYNMEVGKVEDILNNSDVVVKQRYYTQAQAHCALEAHSSTAFIDYQGRLNIISSTQTPFHVRRIISEALSIPISKVHVIKPRIGGGYGGKQAIHGELIAAAVTLKTNKPSKLIYTRNEVFESTYSRHLMRFDIIIGADKKGNIKAIDVELLSDTGAYGEHALTVFMVAGSKTLPMYNKVEAVRFGGKTVYTNHTPAGAFRGYGAIQGNFALESTIDMLAEKLNMSGVEIRRQNMIREGQTSPIFKIMGEGTEGIEMNVDSCKLDYCLDRVLDLIKWDKKYPNKNMADGKVRGVGMAIAMQGSGIPYIDMAAAVLKLNDGGFFNLLIGATDLGTGSDTILAQIAAEALGVTVDKIIVYSSDTDTTPFDTGAYASSTTYISGHAVRKTAEKMKKLIEEEGARRFKVSNEMVQFNGTDVVTKDGTQRVSLKDLSNQLYYNHDQKQLIASSSYVGKKSPPPFMAGAVEVEVDRETGKVEVLDYSAVVDCGTTINPNLARIQVEGAIVQGIGMTLYEDVKYHSNGKLITNNFINYKIPTRKEINNIRVEFADSFEPSGPYGAKSVGEIGIDTPPAAIANAIYNAVGVRLTSLPITPEKVLIALKSKEKVEKENENPQ
ncbi:aldehyde oxidase [Clostridium polyendosporum]|uniref:Aldehyde oxidase n=1 Tax=Clostridium polyendosporum TaxID=69208 RepID=A0A919VGD0_9CLOT|nr:molybdopterin cofactor-binding domain-containing protein [Clostridium polyendosporum]GIM29265.1 aldehyde oxidase [Clostridium polyendosporum]